MLRALLQRMRAGAVAAAPAAPLHGVLGNPSADLDSVASAIALAAGLDAAAAAGATAGPLHHGGGLRGLALHAAATLGVALDAIRIVPIVNVPRSVFSTRRDVLWMLHRVGVDADDLLFIDDVDLAALHAARRLVLTLVDHPEVPDAQVALRSAVCAIIDHHVHCDEPQQRPPTPAPTRLRHNDAAADAAMADARPAMVVQSSTATSSPPSLPPPPSSSSFTSTSPSSSSSAAAAAAETAGAAVAPAHDSAVAWRRVGIWRLMAPVGSCSTLVAELLAASAAPAGTVDALDAALAELLAGAVLLDSVNLDRAQGRCTDRDERAAAWLLLRASAASGPRLRETLYGALRAARFDQSALSAAQLLRRDYKEDAQRARLGVASIGCRLADLMRADAAAYAAMMALLAERGIDALLVMAAAPAAAGNDDDNDNDVRCGDGDTTTGGGFVRELLVCGRTPAAVAAVRAALATVVYAARQLQLEWIAPATLAAAAAGHGSSDLVPALRTGSAVAYRQHDSTVSRKILMPLLVARLAERPPAQP